MSTPLVSVIVPNYNHCSYLTLRIESILQQSYTHLELILLDDCSSDGSKEILETYRTDPRVTAILFNVSNSGSTFKQWEKGLRIATGKYVWFAESDDFAAVDFLEKTVAALEENERAVLAFTGSQLVDAQGDKLVLDLDHYASDLPLLTCFTSLNFLTQKMLWKNSVYNASMVLFRKTAAANVQPSYQQFRYCGDWLFWIGICQQGEVVRVNRKLNYFRQHPNKVSPGAEKDGLHFLEGGAIMEYMISSLQLSTYQQWVLEGRTLKRLLKVSRRKPDLRRRVLRSYPTLFKRGVLSIFVYEFDKMFQFSGLQS